MSRRILRTLGLAVLAGLTFAGRVAKIDWRALSLSLIPLAGIGLFLGLSMMTATHLRAEGAPAAKPIDPGYPLAPHYLVHVSDDGVVLLPYTQGKRILDRLKRLSLGRELPDASACARYDKATKQGEDMRHAQRLLAAAVSSVVGKSEERAVASLFSPGGTHAMKGEFAGSNDFEVVAYLVVLPGKGSEDSAASEGSAA